MRFESTSLVTAVLPTLSLVAVAWAFYFAGRLTPGGRLAFVRWGFGIVAALTFGLNVRAFLLLWENLREGGSLSWMRGWIDPTSSPVGIQVGFAYDVVGQSWILLGILLTVLTFVISGESAKPTRKLATALLCGAIGSGIAWQSSTPWMTLIGVAGCVLAAGLALVATASEESETFPVRQLSEPVLGIFVVAVGAGVLVHAGASLRYDVYGAWPQLGSVEFGATLLVLGAYLLLRGFPWLNWIAATPEALVLPRTLVCQVFLASSAFCLLYRLEPHLREVGILPVLGYVGAASGMISALVAGFQENAKRGLACWLNAAQCGSLTALAFVGAGAGFMVFVSATLGALVLFALLFGDERGKPKETKAASGSVMNKVAAVFAVGAALGLPGWVGTLGAVPLLGALWENPPALATAVILYLALGFSFFRILLASWRRLSTPLMHWSLNVFVWLALVSVLTLTWSGTLTGDLLRDGSDRLFQFSLLEYPKELIDARHLTLDSVQRIVPTQLAAVLAGLLIAYWMRNVFAKWEKKRPPFYRFVAQGFFVDEGVGKAWNSIARASIALDAVFARRLWQKKMADFAGKSLEHTARGFAKIDRVSAKSIDWVLKQSMIVPAKVVQVVQNGDLQWYLLLVLFFVVALLGHFYLGT
ncbi:MAG: hypothetical protein AB7F66_09425 [Bacteriovoracia bacterium]